MERDEEGNPRRVLVADQTIYLDRRVWRPRDPAIVLGVDPLPDVILEVDHTTDVRRNKLPVYEAWGFPEVWVDTPDTAVAEPAPARAAGPDHLRARRAGRFRIADESRAFPTWTALQIHAALNESRLGSRTLADLTRVGRRLGERNGTTPDDDPQIRRHRRRAHAAGRASGLAEGFARERARLARQASRKFGPRAAERLAGLIAGLGDPEHLAGVGDLIIDCDDGDDLLSRLSST